MLHLHSVVNSLNKQQALLTKTVDSLGLNLISRQLELATSITPNFRLASVHQESLKAFSDSAIAGLAVNTSVVASLTAMQSILGTYKTSEAFTSAFESIKGISGVMKGFDNTVAMTEVLRNKKYFSISSEIINMLNGLSITETHASLFKSIDWESLREIDIESLVEGSKDEVSTEINSANEGSKDSTSETKVLSKDLRKKLKKAVDRNTGTLSLSALFIFIFEDYVKDIAFLIMEIFLAFMISLTIGSYNAEIKEFAVDRIRDSKTVRDVRKVTTKYLNTTPVYGQHIAFMRTDAFIREGRSSHAPVIESVTEKTVLFIVERKGNWLQVQVEMENSCFYGWVEESKVIKFKKIK